MEKIKKYYWIKLKTDFFNLAEIDFLLSQENGCQYIVLYQMLCLQTANNSGQLSSNFGEMIVPYNIDKIARDTKYFSNDTVIVALELFKKLNLIYIDEGNCYKIAGFDTMVGCETKWAEQKRKQRESPKLLSGQCPTNVLQESEKELEKEIEIEKELERLNDGFCNVYLELNNIELLQNQTSKYDEIFKARQLYLINYEYVPFETLQQFKIYQLAVQRLVDNRQLELLDKLTIRTLEKVFGKILKARNIENVVEYYISSLTNELAK